MRGINAMVLAARIPKRELKALEYVVTDAGHVLQNPEKGVESGSGGPVLEDEEVRIPKRELKAPHEAVKVGVSTKESRKGS